MTVSSSTNRVSYSGNGTLTVFAYTFKVFDESDLTVILRAVLAMLAVAMLRLSRLQLLQKLL